MYTVIAVFALGAMLLFTIWDYRKADGKKRKILRRQFLIIAPVCLVAFILARTVLNAPLQHLYYNAVRIENPKARALSDTEIKARNAPGNSGNAVTTTNISDSLKGMIK